MTMAHRAVAQEANYPVEAEAQVHSAGTRGSARLTYRWAIRRAILGIAILTLSIGAIAWLLHHTIEPEGAVAAPATVDAPVSAPVALQ